MLVPMVLLHLLVLVPVHGATGEHVEMNPKNARLEMRRILKAVAAERKAALPGELNAIHHDFAAKKKAVHELARQWSKKRLERLLASPDPTRITPLLEMDDLTKPHPGIEEKCGGFSKDPTRFHDPLFHCNTVFDKMKAAPGQHVGLSYGIFTFDPWSRYVSNVLGVETHLFDCFNPQAERPFTGENANYKTKYTRHDECVAGKNYEVAVAPDMRPGKSGKASTRVFKRFNVSSYQKQSVLVKIDVEGSEWPVLEALDESDFEKIITLDMELHWCRQADSLRMASGDQARAIKQKILGGLAKLKKHFYVTGRVHNDYPGVHGFGLAGCDEAAGDYIMMSLSYVNKQAFL